MSVVKIIFEAIIIGVVVLWIPGVPPYGNFEIITVAPTMAFKGALDPKNFQLDKMDRLFEGQIVGPESIESSPSDSKVLYASLQDGAIVKITGNGTEISSVARLTASNAEECRGRYWDVQSCGRPLGLRFDHRGFLIATDAYMGIFRIDVNSGQLVNLVSSAELEDGEIGKIFNSIAPAKCGKIYYTVSSTNYYFNEGVGEMFGSPSGRLMVYDPLNNKSKILESGIHFPNGMLLSPEEDFIIFAETLQYRLLRYWLKGPKAGSMEVFLEGLPGSPDNLNLSPSGNILIALVTVHEPGHFNPPVFMFSHPWLRKILLRMVHLVKTTLDFVSALTDFTFTRQISFNILNFESLKPLLPSYGMIVEMDWNGKIVNSWHTRRSSTGDMPFFSDAKIIDGYMFLGSPFNKYLGRVSLTA